LIFEGRKILFISLTRTGSVEYAVSLLDKIKHLDPVVICSEEAATLFPEESLSIKTYSGLTSFFIKTLFGTTRLIIQLNQIKQTYPDLSIVFPVFHPWNSIIARWAKRKEVKVISIIHDAEMHLGEENKKIFLLQNKLMQASDRVVFLTRNERGKAIDKNLIKENKTAILNHPLISMGAKHELEHSEGLKLLYLGRLKSYKGIQNLINACSELEYEKLTIAGEGDLPLDLNSNQIELVRKRLSKDEIRNLIECHHILVLPYVDASQSGILTIGLDSNIPMLISDLPGLKEQLPIDV